MLFRSEVAVQGANAVREVTRALQELDSRADIDVIVITRGGGSVEDLLPFSNEALVRAVAEATTPIVSAIGHEQDSPILDHVADYRASTPTDAGKRIVPSLSEQRAIVEKLHQQGRMIIRRRLEQESHVIADARARTRRTLLHCIESWTSDVSHLRARARSLSPAATLDRGYAVVQGTDGSVVRDASNTTPGDLVTITVQHGAFHASVTEEAAS